MAHRRKIPTFAFFFLVIGMFLVSANANAALHDPSGSFTGLLELVRNSAAAWDGRLRGYAIRLFWGLAVIQFIWTFFPVLFRQSELGEIVGELIRFIMTIGFFFSLLLFSSDWAEAVVNSFRQAGANAAGLASTGIRPGDVFAVAVDLANTIGDAETWNPLTAFMIGLSSIIVLLCFTFIAAFMGMTIIESYVVIHASVIFMGFGASQWTRDFALAITRYAVAVGAKLFILTLIVGLIVDSSKQWAAAYESDDGSMWTMVGLALVCAYLARAIPELIAGMISGTSMGGGSSIGAMAAAGAAGAAAAVTAISGMGLLGAAGSAAGSSESGGLASALSSSLSGGGPNNGMPKTNPIESPNSGSSMESGRSGGASQQKTSTGHQIASGLTRTAGLLSAISVPGMEGAAGISLGSGAPVPNAGEQSSNQNEGGSDFANQTENVIRPVDNNQGENGDTKGTDG